MIKIQNRHCKGCEKMPNIKREDVLYLSYFENDLKEQLIFYVDKQGVARVLHGDAGWSKSYKVKDGNVSLVLAPDETLWFKACCMAVGFWIKK